MSRSATAHHAGTQRRSALLLRSDPCVNLACPITPSVRARPHSLLLPMLHADVKVFEFDELLCIPGCTVGKHSNQPPAIEVQRKAELAAANKATLEKFEAKASADGAVGADGSAPAPKQNQAAAAAAPPPKPRQRPKLPEGYGRCCHYGCQADFLLENNTETSCVYHKDPPVFHEGAKKWTCCGVVKYDFDEFLAVPGCCTGKHEEPVYLE